MLWLGTDKGFKEKWVNYSKTNCENILQELLCH
jgi:hypothetical protein